MASFLVPCGNDPAINTGNNRLSTGDGYGFDASGNTTGDAEGRTFVYDAENKQTLVSDANGVIGQYWYDGDGRRVKKYVPSTGETTVFVYDASGKLAAEYSTVVANSTDAKVAYLTADHLGSPRINTDQNGTVTARHDYHPFGEEIASSQRTTWLNDVDDSLRKKFTGYEKDAESGLELGIDRGMYRIWNGARRIAILQFWPWSSWDPDNVNTEIRVDHEGTIRVSDLQTGNFGSYNEDGTTRTFMRPTREDYFNDMPGFKPDGPLVWEDDILVDPEIIPEFIIIE